MSVPLVQAAGRKFKPRACDGVPNLVDLIDDIVRIPAECADTS